MRLTSQEIETIRRLTRQIFGERSNVYLFGSRVDDKKRGGDIDLFIEGADENCYTLENKVHFLAELKKEIGDQKIDVVFDSETTRHKKLFYNSVLKSRVVL